MSETGNERPPKEIMALARTLSDALLGISLGAMEAALYETAYHALAGALHGAESGMDVDRLRVIQDEASRQQDIVDAQAPEHRLSRPFGRGHGRSGWFDALAVQVTAVLSRERATVALNRSIALRNG